MTTTSQKLALAWPLVICLLFPSLARAETAVPTWVQPYGSYGCQAAAVTADGSNNVIVTGCAGFPSGFATIKYSSAGTPLWTNRYNETAGEWSSYPTAMAVDAEDSAVVTGFSREWFGSVRGWTIKYSSAGLPLWTNRYYYGLLYAYGHANRLAVDGSNNVIVTGWFDGGGSLSISNLATIKYSPDGLPLWTNQYVVEGYEAPTGVVTDGSNNVIVTGFSFSTDRLATIKYSSDGTPLWTNRYSGGAPGYVEDAMAVAVDGSNDVIVMCHSWRQGSSYDYATIKYSSAGVPLWTNRYNGPGNGKDFPRALAVDASNNVIVTGCSGPEGATNYATIKYSSAGVPLWTNRYSSPGSTNDSACAVAVDGNNNVIVTGYSWDGQRSYDYATVGYSSAGLPLWTNRYQGPGNTSDYPAAVAVDGHGNVIVTGTSTPNSSGSRFGVFATVKYEFPLVITGSRSTDGTFEMLVDNLQPGTLVIEAATNLAANPPDWSPVFTNTTPTNVLFYTDPDASSLSNRFYRAYQFP